MTSIPASTMALLGIKYRLLALPLLLSVAFSLAAQHLQEGDLLFACSLEPNAITQVTTGVDALPIDHVAVAHRIGGDTGLLYVIEAVKPVVRLTPIQEFLDENGTVLIGRIHGDFDIKTSIRRCLAMVGKPVNALNKADRLRLIGLLNNRKAFSFRKSVPFVSQRLGVSRYTVYKYLSELAEQEEELSRETMEDGD